MGFVVRTLAPLMEGETGKLLFPRSPGEDEERRRRKTALGKVVAIAIWKQPKSLHQVGKSAERSKRS